MSFIASVCVLNAQKALNYWDHDNVLCELFRVSHEEEKETTTSRFSQELEREKERIVKEIYNEDQRELDGLQTTAQKRENVRRHVDEFIKAQDMETRVMIHQKQLFNYKHHNYSLFDYERKSGAAENGDKIMTAEQVFADAMHNIRLELFKNMDKDMDKEEEMFKIMMLHKFAEYDKICMQASFS